MATGKCWQINAYMLGNKIGRFMSNLLCFFHKNIFE